MRYLKIISLFILCVAISCKQEPGNEKNINAWYKNVTVYNLDVKTFKDSNGDGEGDFNGLISKLDYIKDMGIDMIWLAPFQPSPLQDDGYDVTDYYGIDPKLGTKSDFENFMKQARTRHIRIIMDLVLNHTSIKHPWYIEASHGLTSPKHDWYVWSMQRPKDWDKGMGFPGVEKETWTYDNNAHAYYFHRFYTFQPDLNYQNPEVENEAKHIMGYWLDKGMDGFRLDAVPFIIDDPRKSAESPRFDFNVLHHLTTFVKQRKPDAVLLGEANVEPDENKKYFLRNKEGLDMMFNFYANQYLFYGFATGNTDLFKEALNKTKIKPGAAQWAWFLRNHDEIDLGRLNHHQYNEVTDAMGPDTSMQLYKRGIRRRLAPMLGDDMQRLHMAYCLLYALPGTPVIRSGEDIGMGDDLHLKERLAIRTPMQWDSTLNGGFSSAKITFRPMITSVEYGYKKVNVAAEQKDPRSLLNFIRNMIRMRKAHPELNNGEWSIPDTNSDNVLAIRYNENGKQLLVCYNFSKKQQDASLTMNGISHVTNILTDPKSSGSFKDDKLKLKMDAYGYQWYQIN
jgi:maltose alpha-D-glucosyltransferase / alpha-amylase